MNWPDVQSFLAMGGYGLYVWGAFVPTAVLMLVEPALTVTRYRRALRADPATDEPADPSALPESA